MKSADRPRKQTPAKAGAGPAPVEEQYRAHFHAHRLAAGRYDAAMRSLETAEAQERITQAIDRIRATFPAEATQIADSIFAIEEAWSAGVDALIEANYHECCKRTLAPDLLKGKQAARNARKRWAGDPKAAAMAEIRQKWEKEGRPGASFARRMHAQYAAVITSNGAIENAIGRWRKEESSS